MRIHKFTDHIDFNCAYVVAKDSNRALKILMQHTQIKCELVDCRPLDDFPRAIEFYEFHGEGVWKSDINPF